MGMCLDLEGCGFANREKARFCAHCGIPLEGIFLQGRYEVQELALKERKTVTLRALDRHQGQSVLVRALIPQSATEGEREEFLQDAELAASLSERVEDPGSVRVLDYGQDGPLVFLIKAEQRGGAEIASRSTLNWPGMPRLVAKSSRWISMATMMPP
ncbi:hypothetical protein KSD_37990 [Ktedonobacter sp. SOSP1-85]|uniref:zinc ribbon domain-containing protein n=1 Tax=Ktedonobacter sp. SOSP1-85 TaxID=2778367 RepID=UPI001915E4E2|nr:zinc ribbon domain-containing protein [Ktedonobacter sp. SOSP1-85]GHO76028.1 hypothetical protein KSD_37990 [Ktedonobacter sp. SOSP1-85]